MATYLMLGRYSADALKGASAARTKKANALIEKCGGKIISVHALLGCHDLALLVEFPGNQEAMKASFELGKLTGIGFTTAPAIPIEEFDKLISG